MSNAALPPLPAGLAAALEARPTLAQLYRDFYSVFADDCLPPGLLARCFEEIATCHGYGQRPAAASEATPAESAALVVAAKLPWQHHEISDAEVAALREHLDERQVVALITALALFDANVRMEIALNGAKEDH